MNALDDFTRALENAGCNPRNHTAKCPAHQDGNPSLSYAQGNRGIVFHCHAGCSANDILDKLDLKWSSVFDEPRDTEPDDERYYPYCDEDGELLYQVIRRPGKKFSQRRPSPDGSWIYKLGDVRRTIYRLPSVLAAAAAGHEVWVVEGEKDADRLAADGLAVTCNSGGAGNWQPNFGRHFEGASIVNIIADRDTPGRTHAEDVAISLEGIAKVKTWEAREGKDVSDHFAAGYKLGDLVPLETEDLAQSPNSLLPYLLTERDLNSLVPPEPLIEGWLFRNTLAFLTGPPKKGKTFIALDMAMAVANGVDWVGGTNTSQGKVLYVLGEGTAGLPKRVSAWRCAKGIPLGDDESILWLKRAAQLKDKGELAELIEICEMHRPDLVVIDTFARSAVGVEENSAKEVGEVIAGLDEIKFRTGACVLVVHHSGKDVGRGARGSSALGGAWDTSILVDGDTKVMTLRNDQQKDVEAAEPIGIAFDNIAGSIVPRRLDEPPVTEITNRDSDITNARMELTSAIRRERKGEPMTKTDWIRRAKGRDGTKNIAFWEMVGDGYFARVDVETVNKAGDQRTVEMYVADRSKLAV